MERSWRRKSQWDAVNVNISAIALARSLAVRIFCGTPISSQQSTSHWPGTYSIRTHSAHAGLSGVLQRWTYGTGSTYALESQGSEETRTARISRILRAVSIAATSASVLRVRSGREDDPRDDMMSTPGHVEECAGIRAILEWLLGLAGRAKVVGSDKDKGVEILEDVLGLKTIT